MPGSIAITVDPTVMQLSEKKNLLFSVTSYCNTCAYPKIWNEIGAEDLVILFTTVIYNNNMKISKQYLATQPPGHYTKISWLTL